MPATVRVTPADVVPAVLCCRVGRTARAGRSGWSLSFITQFDVELVHQIEGLIGHQLQVGGGWRVLGSYVWWWR